MNRADQLEAGLLLLHVEGAIADVLRSHTEDVATALPRIEQKHECKSRAGSYWVVPFELLDLIVCPTVVAIAPGADSPHIAGWIVSAQADLDSVLHQDPQPHTQSVGGTRLLGPRCHQLDDVIAPQVGRALVAMILTESLDDPSIGALR
jgi:hypothetical protein